MRRGFIKPIEERYLRGLFAGLIAGVIKDIPDLFLVDLFKIKKLGFWDYVGEMFFAQIPRSFFEHFVAFSMEVAFSMALGIIFSQIIIPLFPTKHYLVRGTIYGCSCWFVLSSVIKLFYISALITKGDLFTPLATLLFSAGYGLLLGYLDKVFSPQKQKLNA